MEITDKIIQHAQAGDLETLAMLDSKGFLIGAHESADQFAERLKTLRHNIREMDRELEENGRFLFGNYSVTAEDRIPAGIFTACSSMTEHLYSFRIDWVPGFFVTPSFSWLFGGCAFYSFPDFFTFFIIRQCFARKKRWLIYDRDELLAHELCHVARIGLQSNIFEENFAYKTASSRFRRKVGGMFRGPFDAFLLLGSTLILLLSQVTKTFFLPGLDVAYFWGVVGLAVLSLGTRHLSACLKFRKCLKKLAGVSPDFFLAVAFRCTDTEIHQLASGKVGDIRSWINSRTTDSLRWQVIQHRFISEDESVR